MNTVAFTGYRPEKMPFSEDEEDESYIRFREQQHKVINRLIERGYTEYLSGVAMGFDTWVAEDILEFRKKNKSLHLECAIPLLNDKADHEVFGRVFFGHDDKYR